MKNLSLKKCCICNNEIYGSFTIIGEDKYHLSCIEKLRKRNESLEKENKILRENAEHNGKVVDKYRWENKWLQAQNDELFNKKYEILKFIEENKNKRYAPYGDNEDEDFEICLNEDDIDVLTRIVKNEYDYENR